jgi:hypothetical protein
MDFGEVLTKAGKIIWKFKVLWIFGILASCGQRASRNGGNGGGGNTGFQFSGDWSDLPQRWQFPFHRLENFFDTIQAWQIAAFIIGILLFVLFYIFIVTAINTVGKIGLIKGTINADDGAEKLRFGELFNEGKPYFWRVYAFKFLTVFAVLAAILLLFIPIVGIGVLTAGIGMICLVPLICLLIPLAWLISLLIKQILIAMVAEDLTIRDAIVRGWEVFRDNFANFLLLGLILGIGTLVIGLLLAIPLLIATVPSVVGIIAGLATGSDAVLGGSIALALIGLLIVLPIVILFDGVLQSYITAAWTLAFRRLTGSTSPVKVEEESTLEDGL